MADVKILIVEDERIIAKAIERSLKSLGYSISASVASGKAAIEAIAEDQPDLVLMDIVLKGEMDGIKTAEKIRSSFDVPIVYLTSHSDEHTLQRAKATEPYGYIIKPFEEKDLYITIEIALRRHLSEVALRATLEAEALAKDKLRLEIEIAERKRAETEIRKALAKEQELSELKTRFVTMVSHEFRTPLSTILMCSELLQTYNHKLTEEKRQNHHHHIQSAVEQMVQLLENILIIGKVEADKLQFNPDWIDPVELCSELFKEIQQNVGDAYTLIFNHQGTRSTAYLDEKLLRALISNLLSNAIKYSPPGSKVQLNLVCRPEAVIFQIQDQGIGILAEEQEQIFQAFQRGSNVGNTDGTGLGLAIVQKSVDLHQGTIALSSNLGAGTTFTVTLPSNPSYRGAQATPNLKDLPYPG